MCVCVWVFMSVYVCVCLCIRDCVFGYLCVWKECVSVSGCQKHSYYLCTCGEFLVRLHTSFSLSEVLRASSSIRVCSSDIFLSASSSSFDTCAIFFFCSASTLIFPFGGSTNRPFEEFDISDCNSIFEHLKYTHSIPLKYTGNSKMVDMMTTYCLV